MDSTAILRVLKNIRNVGSIFQQFFHTGEGWGMEQGCTCLDSSFWGVCDILIQKLLNQKALTKRFSFVVHMNTWTNTY